MKIAVFGATGNIGSRIVAEATARGHEVTALSRRAPTDDASNWQCADAADPAAVAAIADGHDAVVAAHGPSRIPGDDPAAFIAEFKAFADAVGDARLLVVGGAGSLLVAPGTRLVDLPEFPEIYKPEALAHAAVLDDLRAGGRSNWTYLSPSPVIEAGQRTGAHRLGNDSPVGDWVSYEDFAVAVVDELEQNAHPGARFTVATR